MSFLGHKPKEREIVERYRKKVFPQSIFSKNGFYK